MRGQLTAGIGLGVGVAVGATLVAKGAIAGGDTEYRLGLALLLVGLAGLVMHRSNSNTQRLIKHQTHLAALTLQEQQQWAERGYRAGELETLHALGQYEEGARVVSLHRAQKRRHRSGA